MWSGWTSCFVVLECILTPNPPVCSIYQQHICRPQELLCAMGSLKCWRAVCCKTSLFERVKICHELRAQPCAPHKHFTVQQGKLSSFWSQKDLLPNCSAITLGPVFHTNTPIIKTRSLFFRAQFLSEVLSSEAFLKSSSSACDMLQPDNRL